MQSSGEDTGDAGESPAVEGLTEQERAVLDFESRWRRHSGAKESAIRESFGFSAARYYQILNTVIDSPSAPLYDPMLVRHVRAVRDSRLALRGGARVSRARSDH